MKKISIIVTVYNMERYIGQCLDSILNQNEKSIEIICVDDASTDQSLRVMQEYQEKDNRMIILHNERNLGQASSRNKGIKKAQGEYLYIVDGDDYLPGNALETMYMYAKNHELDLLTFEAETFPDSDDMIAWNERNKNLYKRQYSYEGVKAGAQLFSEIISNGETLGNFCLNLIRRDFFLQNNLYMIENMRYNEDSPFEIYLKANRAACINQALYMRRYRQNSVTSSGKKATYLESILIMFMKELSIWKTCSLTTEQDEMVKEYFIMQYRYAKQYYEELDEIEKRKIDFNNYPMENFIFHYMFQNQSLYCRNLTAETIQKIKKYKNVIIYGAGIFGRKTKELLEQNGIMNSIFAVTKKGYEKNIDESMIYEINELNDIENAIVLLAAQKRHYKAMESTLTGLGFENWIVVD